MIDFKKMFKIMLIVMGIFFLLNIIMVTINPPQEEEKEGPITIVSPYLSEANLEVVSASGEVKPVNTSCWMGEDDLLYILGEIENDSYRTIEPRWVRLNMFDREGGKLGEEETFSYAFCLGPGDKSPFVLKTDKLPQRVTVDVKHRVAEKIPFDFRVNFEMRESESEDTIQNPSTMVIQGEVINNDDREARDAQVIVTFYDERGRVMDVRRAEWTTTFVYFKPGDTRRFSLNFKSNREIEDYNILVVARDKD
jgi:hypothetical protein